MKPSVLVLGGAGFAFSAACVGAFLYVQGRDDDAAAVSPPVGASLVSADPRSEDSVLAEPTPATPFVSGDEPKESSRNSVAPSPRDFAKEYEGRSLKQLKHARAILGVEEKDLRKALIQERFDSGDEVVLPFTREKPATIDLGRGGSYVSRTSFDGKGGGTVRAVRIPLGDAPELEEMQRELRWLDAELEEMQRELRWLDARIAELADQ